MEFKSKICTTREQSERLLALGLKRETADMCWTQEEDGWGELQWYCRVGTFTQKDAEIGFFDYIPAWSLHRLMEMVDPWEYKNWIGEDIENDYDNMIQCISFLIDDRRFNKEYLEE